LGLLKVVANPKQTLAWFVHAPETWSLPVSSPRKHMAYFLPFRSL
jgi:hypothetical protein